MQSLAAIGSAACTDDVLSTKIKELMALARDVAIHCDGCVA